MYSLQTNILAKKFSVLTDFFSVQILVFLHYIKHLPFWTSILTFCNILDTSSSLVQAYFISVLIDSVVKSIQDGKADIQTIQINLMWFLIYALLMVVNRSIMIYSSKVISTHGNFLFERIYYKKLNSLSSLDLSSPTVANFISRGKDHIYRTHELLESSVSIFSSLITAVSGAAVILIYFPSIFPIILFVTLAKGTLMSKSELDLVKWKEKETYARRVAHATSDYMVEESLDRMEFHLCKLLNFFDQKYYSYISNYINNILKFHRKLRIWNFLFDFIFSLTIVGLYYFLFTQALAGLIGVGLVTFIASATQNFVGQISDTTIRFSKLTAMVKDVGYVFDLLNYQPKIKDGHHLYQAKRDQAPSIVFENVSFRYPGASRNIFTNLNLEIKSGEKIAIVGENGAGKSTLIKLIARAYQVDKGRILIDGQDLNSFKIDSWYKSLGVLFQEFAFYRHLSVKENIFCGDTSKPLNERKVVISAKYADAHDFIQDYPNRYEEIMDPQFNGTTPSGGQKQKIAIARFFYRNAPLAIFDEPTSAIDAVSEAKIFNRIYNFFKQKTVIIVSHRFSTVRNADRIIVVEHGKIVEEGTHKQLLALDGSYARAYRLQAEGYQ